jgi:hypothetical protein
MSQESPTSMKRRLPRLRIELDASQGTVIGRSQENRPIICFRRGPESGEMKLLVLAGQHGDERSARRTLQSLLTASADEVAARLPAIQLAIIPEANPDGCAARSRCNADGIDLNRDHQLLLSNETVAIHRFVRRWQPHVILDLHNYPSRRRHLLERNVVLNHDVFIDVPSHPAILARPGHADGAEVLRDLLGAITARNVSAGRYTIVADSNRARHSTPDVVDARNGLALRYGAFTVLVENRQPRREETTIERQRLRGAQEQALWAVLEWLNSNHNRFTPLSTLEPPAPGTPVPVHFKYSKTERGLLLVCRDVHQGRPTAVTFSRYLASLVVRRAVPLPAGYAVPSTLESLINLLHRHGFVSSQYRAGEMRSVETLRIEPRPRRRPDRPVQKVVKAVRQLSRELDRYEVFPTQQRGGDSLAVFLEPESKHGLHRFAAVHVPLLAPSWYPVLRVFDGPSPRGSHDPAAENNRLDHDEIHFKDL